MIPKKESRIRSKRIYPVMQCFNPLCDFGKQFIPHDRRQKFCSEQCRINWNNDYRRDQNNTRFADEKVLREIERTLEKLYIRYATENYCQVHKAYFAHEEIDILNYMVKKVNNALTGGEISWFYHYGVSQDVKRTDYFLIIKKLTK